MALLLSACVPVTSDPPSPSSSEFFSPSLVFEEQEYDFGVIKQSEGKVSHDFWFTYEGDGDLKILSTPTSCSCTTASFDPEILPSGKWGKIMVVFNPNLHEEPEGRFYKTVSVLTEPSISPLPEVKIWVQIDLNLGPEAFEIKGHQD